MTLSLPTPSGEIRSGTTLDHLDGLHRLRGLAALTVAVCHATMWTLELQDNSIPILIAFSRAAADAAVIIFFVLSGVVIGINERGHFTKVSLSGYALRRLVRIYPIYFAGLVGGYVASGATILSNEFVAGALFLQMWLVPAPPYNGALWSLHYEVAFYAMYPAITILPIRTLPLAIALMLGSIVLIYSTNHLFIVLAYFSLWLFGLWLSQLPRHYTKNGCRLRTPLCLLIVAFFLGNPISVLLAHAAAPPIFGQENLPHPIVAAASGIAVTALVASYCGIKGRYLAYAVVAMIFSAGSMLAFAFYRGLFNIPAYQALTVTVLAAATSAAVPMSLKPFNHIAKWLGDISYALYAFHVPLILLAHNMVPRTSGWAIWLAANILALFVSIALAWLAEVWLQPIIRHAISQRAPAIKVRPDKAQKQ